MLLSTIITALVMLCMPFAILLNYCLFSLYRAVVGYFVKLFKPAFGDMLCPSSVMMVDDEHTSCPYNFGICCSMEVGGEMGLEELSKTFTDTILNAKLDPKSDLLRYPQLRQYSDEFLGCGFWRCDPDFEIGNHIKEEESPRQCSSLAEIHQRHLNKIFAGKRSPWELILVRGGAGGEGNSLLIFHIHHYMVDAKSICQLVMGSLGRKPVRSATARGDAHARESTWHNVRNWIRLPYDLGIVIKSNIEAVNGVRAHPFKIWDKELRTAPVNVGFSGRIPIHEVRGLARLLEVRPAALIYAVVGRALMKFREEFSRPKRVTMVISLNKPDHTEGLVNHFNASTTTFSTNMSTSATDQIQGFNRKYEQITTRNALSCVGFLSQMGGLQITPIRRGVRNQLAQQIGCAVLVSNLVFDEEGFSIGGGGESSHPCTDWKMTLGCTQFGQVGLVILPQSYKGGLSYSVMANSNLLDEVETGELAEMISDEFSCLYEEFKGRVPKFSLNDNAV